MKIIGGPASTYQRIFGVTDGNYAGKPGKTLLESGVNLRRFLIGVPGQVGIKAEEQNVAGIEPGIEIVKIAERAHEHACADEKQSWKERPGR